MEEEQKPRAYPEERAYEPDDRDRHVVSHVNELKDHYFDSPDFAKYKERTTAIRYLVDQEWEPGKKKTRYGLIHGLCRGAYDNYVDSLDDLFDVDTVVMANPENKDAREFADDWAHYANRLLNQIKYQDHLSERFLTIPDYGWSVAHDSYQHNRGWVVKPQAASYMPGFEGLEFTQDMDVLNDKPVSKITHPLDWWGNPAAGTFRQGYQGDIVRWHVSDVVRALEKTDANGEKLYNEQALRKILEKLKKGEQDGDSHKHQENREHTEKEHKRPYVDVVRFYGSLENCPGYRGDPNQYYIECTRDAVLLKRENPKDGYTPFTHMQTHRKPGMPFGRSFLDSIVPHQRLTDMGANLSIENVVDSMHRVWGVWEDDLLDPNAFYNPKGTNTFLQMTGQRLPQLIQSDARASTADFESLRKFLDMDRQRVGATDQEQGIQGDTQDKTATAARILASASSKKIRATVKRFTRQAVIPQVENLVMLSLVYGPQSQRKFMSADGKREIVITPQHVEHFIRGGVIQVNDTITRDRNEEAMKATNWFQMALQIAPQLATPEVAIKVLRHSGKLLDIPVDEIIPEPLPPEIGQPPMGPPGLPPPQGMPPGMDQLPPEMQAEMGGTL